MKRDRRNRNADLAADEAAVDLTSVPEDPTPAEPPPELKEFEETQRLIERISRAFARELTETLKSVNPQLVVEQAADDWAPIRIVLRPTAGDEDFKKLLGAQADRRISIISVLAGGSTVSIGRDENDARRGFRITAGNSITVSHRQEVWAHVEAGGNETEIDVHTEYGLDEPEGA